MESESRGVEHGYGASVTQPFALLGMNSVMPQQQQGGLTALNEKQWASAQGTPAAAKSPSFGSIVSGSALSGWIGARGVTLILGLMLIAAAIFTHPVVIENAKSAGRLAAAVAA